MHRFFSILPIRQGQFRQVESDLLEPMLGQIILGDESQFTLTLLLTTAAGLPGRRQTRLTTPLLREGMKIENDELITEIPGKLGNMN